MKKVVFGLVVLTSFLLRAQAQTQTANAREAFMKQQAYNEVVRVSGQVDMLESNQAALAERIGRLEKGGGEVSNLKADIEALRSEINRLRNEMRNQRTEIVNDLLKRINSREASAKSTPAPAPAIPTGTYTVRSGDTLSLISQAFGTSVSTLKEMNSLKSDVLRVGQQLKVPAK